MELQRAGRPAHIEAPWSTDTEAWTYDAYGRLASITTPSATVSSYSYDEEGEKLSQSISSPSSTTEYLYDNSGELVGDNDETTGGALLVKEQSANGVEVPVPNNALRQTTATAWDVRTGAVLGQAYESLYEQTKTEFTALWTYGYDTLGRQVTAENNATTTYTDSNNDQCTVGEDATATSSYDDAGRLSDVNQSTIEYPPLEVHPPTCSGEDPTTVDGPDISYDYGSNEHPDVVSAEEGDLTYYPTTLHWDGDAPLFESASNVGLIDSYVGSYARFYPASGSLSATFGMDARDDGGYMTQVEYAPGSWASSTAYHGNYDPFNPNTVVENLAGVSEDNYGDASQNITFDMPRSDGITDSVSTFQGARDYNGTSMQWTEPDPSSSAGYVWNGNNPLTQSDPTGNSSVCTGNPACNLPVIAHVVSKPQPLFAPDPPMWGPVQGPPIAPQGGGGCSPCAVPWVASAKSAPSNGPHTQCPSGTAANTSGPPDYHGGATEYGVNANGSLTYFAYRRTASGSIFDPWGYTGATIAGPHGQFTIPENSFADVVSANNPRSNVVVKITDTGALGPGDVIDLSAAAMKQLTGKAYNRVEVNVYECHARGE